MIIQVQHLTRWGPYKVKKPLTLTLAPRGKLKWGKVDNRNNLMKTLLEPVMIQSLPHSYIYPALSVSSSSFLEISVGTKIRFLSFSGKLMKKKNLHSPRKKTNTEFWVQGLLLHLPKTLKKVNSP